MKYDSHVEQTGIDPECTDCQHYSEVTGCSVESSGIDYSEFQSILTPDY